MASKHKIYQYASFVAAAALLVVLLVLELLPGVPVPVFLKLGAVVLVSVFLSCSLTLYLRTFTDVRKKIRSIRGTAWIVFGLYIALLGNLLFFDELFGRGIKLAFGSPEFGGYFLARTNFTPFATISGYFHSMAAGNVKYGLLNLVGNLVAFMPMGFFLPALLRHSRRTPIFLIDMIGILIGTEMLQLLLMTGSCDIDDVLLNMIGALLGYAIVRSERLGAWLRKIGLPVR